MARLTIRMNWTERQRIIGGAIALVTGTICILSLTATGIRSGLGAAVLALTSVVLFVAGTLSIGAAGQTRV